MVVRYGNIFLSRGIAVSLDGVSPRDRLARALLDAFHATPGRALSPETLVAVGWPESPPDPLARGKLKVTVCRLRAAGLPILTLGAGYAIDPRALVVVADQPAAERTKHRPPEDRFVPVRSVVA